MAESPKRILVVEDDLSILTGVSMNLRYEGYEVLQAQDGRTGLQKAIDETPDLVILDLMLPALNGFEVLKELRGRGVTIPVLVLSAKGMESDKIVGLNLGADDYVVKPFSLQELLARVRAVLRRQQRDSSVVQFAGVIVDLRAKTVTREGQSVDLTAQAAWGYGYEGTARTVDNFISQLRQKLEPLPDDPRHFVTVRGQGYRFDP
ncbi:MAG: Alkaline phosphatase synthesis transcriptional regulatory protein PhoP [Myxococcaceae bacterium]|nr:Alkaline phosphatase synthesis transcriptional regulatory protein PhoP [Myxococcaceae bacterium]